jgi:hypothetical protein
VLPLCINAQEKEQWQHIYTYEKSSVEADAANVVFGSDFTGRVKFRFSFTEPQLVPDGRGIIYRRVIQTMEMRCYDRSYRVVSVERLDRKGRRVDVEEYEAREWREVKRGSMMERLFKPGCDLIEEKRRNP